MLRCHDTPGAVRVVLAFYDGSGRMVYCRQEVLDAQLGDSIVSFAGISFRGGVDTTFKVFTLRNGKLSPLCLCLSDKVLD